MIEKNVCCGYLYDGEIIFALINLDLDKWKNNELLKKTIKIAEKAIVLYDDGEKMKINEWIKKVKVKKPKN